jgi:hypothetical protein
VGTGYLLGAARSDKRQIVSLHFKFYGISSIEFSIRKIILGSAEPSFLIITSFYTSVERTGITISTSESLLFCRKSSPDAKTIASR